MGSVHPVPAACPTAAARVTVVVTPTPGLRDAAARERVVSAAARELALPGLALEHDGDGRPVLRCQGPHPYGGAPAHVSLSHGRGVAALALTGLGPVGVDVEAERPMPAHRLARRWFTGAEAAWVRRWSGPEESAAYLWLWTHKEAMGKALGTGLAHGGLLRAAPLPPAGPRDSARLAPVAGSPGLSAAAPDAGPRVHLALAVLGGDAPGTPVDVRHVPRVRRSRHVRHARPGTALPTPPR